MVIHVDRIRKLPISSVDEGESSVDMSTDPHTHASEDKETSVVPSKWHRLQPATDVSTSRAAATENCSGGGDSILPVDETANNHSNVFYKAINAADAAVTDMPDTCWTPHLASLCTGNVGDYTRAPMGNAGGLLTLCTGRRKRRHCGRPKRFLERIEISSASSPLIGRDNLPRGITSHGTYRLANACMVIAILMPSCSAFSQLVSLCDMSHVNITASGVAPTTSTVVDAPVTVVKAPSGATPRGVGPAEPPPMSLFDWGQGPFARGSDRGASMAWRAPTSARQGPRPQRAFLP